MTITTSTEAINTTNYPEYFVSKDENATLSYQYGPNTESSTDTTMNEENNTTELDNIEKETHTEEKFEKNENETFIEYKTSTLNESDELTTELVTESLSNSSASKPKLIENSTDLSEYSLSSLSRRSPEIEDILHDFRDKHSHFLGTIPSEIANDTTSIEELLIKPFAELSSVNDTLALSSQMATEQYEWIDTSFKPSETEQNDSLEPFFGENPKQSDIQPRLENTHLISDEELLSLENTTTFDSESGQEINIELIPENHLRFTLTTDESSNLKQGDNDNINLRLAEESLFQPTNTMKNIDFDIEPIREFDSMTNKPSQINEPTSNDTYFIAEHSINDYVTTEEPQDYDAIEPNTQTEYSIKPKSNTEQSISIYSTFINRLKTTSSIVHINDRIERSALQTVKEFDTSTKDEYSDKVSITDPTIETSQTLIIKQPPNQGKSMQIANINCYLKNLVNEQYSQICT